MNTIPPTILNDVEGRAPKASQRVSTELIFCVVGIVILLLIILFCILRRKGKNDAGKLQDKFNQAGLSPNVLDNNSPSFHSSSIDEHITASGSNAIEGNAKTGNNGNNDLTMDIKDEGNNNVTLGGPVNDVVEYIAEVSK